MRLWCSGNIRLFQSFVVGSNPSSRSLGKLMQAPVAQRIERRTSNPQVVGSTPTRGASGIVPKVGKRSVKPSPLAWLVRFQHPAQQERKLK